MRRIALLAAGWLVLLPAGAETGLSERLPAKAGEECMVCGRAMEEGEPAYLFEPRTAYRGGGNSPEIEFYIGSIFPLISRHRNRHLNGAIYVDNGLFLGVGVRELPDRTHDLADPLDPFERLIDRCGHFPKEELQVREPLIAL